MVRFWRPWSAEPVSHGDAFLCGKQTTRGPNRIRSWLIGGATFVVLIPLATAAQAQSATDWSECLRAKDLRQREEACTAILGETRDPKSIVRALTGRGNAICATAARCGEAVSDFAAVVKLEPKIPGYLDNYARALRAAGRYDEALAASDRAIALAPQAAFLYVGKAKTLAAAGKGAEAVAVVERAMSGAPTDAGLLEYEGKLLGDLHRFPESHAAFDHALRLQPTRASVYVRRADVELAEGQTAEAIRDLERYPPDGSDAEQVHGKLDLLRTLEARRVSMTTSAPEKPMVAVVEVPMANSDQRQLGRSAEDSEAALADAKTCNLNDWLPLQRCIEEYHNENDPLPDGVPNPRGWNEELAAHGHTLAEQHPEISWDKSVWNQLAAEAKQTRALKLAERTPVEDEPVGSSQPDISSIASSEEVDKCNSERVLRVMTDSVEKFKGGMHNVLAHANGADYEAMLRVVDKWQMTIRNIRQLSYSPENNSRSCAADFEYNLQLPPMIALFGLGTPGVKDPCIKAVTYTIEKTLDNPAGVYVTHTCR